MYWLRYSMVQGLCNNPSVPCIQQVQHNEDSHGVVIILLQTHPCQQLRCTKLRCVKRKCLFCCFLSHPTIAHAGLPITHEWIIWKVVLLPERRRNASENMLQSLIKSKGKSGLDSDTFLWGLKLCVCRSIGQNVWTLTNAGPCRRCTSQTGKSVVKFAAWNAEQHSKMIFRFCLSPSAS